MSVCQSSNTNNVPFPHVIIRLGGRHSLNLLRAVGCLRCDEKTVNSGQALKHDPLNLEEIRVFRENIQGLKELRPIGLALHHLQIRAA